MLLLLLLVAGSHGQDLLTPVDAVPTEELNLRNDKSEPSTSDSESEEPREGKAIAQPLPAVPGAIFRDSPVVHPVPHDGPVPVVGGAPPPP